MNAMADVKVMKTAAETALADTFTQARPLLPGGTAIAAQRAAAFDLFAKEGLPHRRVEDWKYTDLRALMREAKPLASPPDAQAKARAKSAGALLADVECRRLLFVDGAFVPELSDMAALEGGLTVGSLADALAGNDHALAAASRQARAVERCRGCAQYGADGRWRRDPHAKPAARSRGRCISFLSRRKSRPRLSFARSSSSNVARA